MRQSRNKKHERKKKTFKELGFFLGVIVVLCGFFFIFLQDEFINEAKGVTDDLPEQSLLTSNTSSEIDDSKYEPIHSDDVKEDALDEDKSAEDGENTKAEGINEDNEVDENKQEENNQKDTPIQQEQNDTQKVVYLTFDDGPQEITIEILNLLDRYNAKATFFMLEPYMKQYPEVIKDMLNRGHQVGLHSVTHDKRKIYASSQSVVNEMVQSQDTLEHLTGVESNLIRVPYGSVPHMKPEYIAAVENNGFIMWDWNVDSLDWKYTDGSYVNHTINQIEAFKKDEPIIILMHDRTTTVAHLEELLIYLQDNQYDMLAIDETMVPVQFNH